MMRENVIQNAINFLKHPQVASTSLEKKVGFLQSKTLSQEEITEAFKRQEPSQISNLQAILTNTLHSPTQANSSDSRGEITHATQVHTDTSLSSHNSGLLNPSPSYEWTKYIFPVVLIVAGGVAAGIYIRRLFPSYFDGIKINKETKESDQLLEDKQTNQLNEIHDELKVITNRLHELVNLLSQTASADKAQALLQIQQSKLLSQCISDSGTSNVIDTKISSRLSRDSYEKAIQSSLDLMHSDAKKSLQNTQLMISSINLLCLYLNNIIDNPHDSKYRKIQTNNQRFESRIKNIPGALPILITVGFEQNGSILEWSGDNKDENYLLLKNTTESLCNTREILQADEALRTKSTEIEIS